MAHDNEPAAVAQWVIQNRVFIFYGNGGVFSGAAFERWFSELEAAGELRLYVGATGSTFSFGAEERSRATAFFKQKKLRFAVITESVRLRMLGQTARLVGMNLGLYSWRQSFEPFVELGIDRSLADSLHNRLLDLRDAVERELQARGG